MAFYYMYTPPPFHTTYVSPTFPERHLPFEHARHRVGQAISEINPFSGDQMEHVYTPNADIRETAKEFYIDVELPGLRPKDALEVRWIDNDNALMVDATLKRPDIEESTAAEPAEAEAASSTKAEHSEADKKAAAEDKNRVHILAHERRIGRFVRSFDFSSAVDHETMDVKVSNGLLRIVVEKKPQDKKPAKTVEVRHVDG